MVSVRKLKKNVNCQDRVLGVEHVYRVLETLDGMVGGQAKKASGRYCVRSEARLYL